MDIGQIAIIGIIATLLIVVLKPVNPSITVLLSLGTCILIFIFILPKLSEVIVMLKNFSNYIDYKNLYIDVVLKIIGIAYIAEISAQICLDAGEGAIASKIEIGGKILIMVTSLPIISQILKTVVTILP